MAKSVETLIVKIETNLDEWVKGVNKLKPNILVRLWSKIKGR